MTNKKYIKFREITDPKRKPKKFLVINISMDYQIGEIKWFPQWRQYCFFPDEETVYSEGCLTDIIEFIQKLKR